ncbi:hypothetical protein P8452_12200 [Trifolium repens]|nr:hypothetical protein P8452_12200 [Trifolium repens]
MTRRNGQRNVGSSTWKGVFGGIISLSDALPICPLNTSDQLWRWWWTLFWEELKNWGECNSKKTKQRRRNNLGRSSWFD